MKVLHLTLKKKWFDMIVSGEKKEEYREIKPFWIKRFLNGSQNIDPSVLNDKMKPLSLSEYTYLEFWRKEFDIIVFKNGYSAFAPSITIDWVGLEVGHARPEWSDNWQGDVFVIKLGDIIEIKP